MQFLQAVLGTVFSGLSMKSQNSGYGWKTVFNTSGDPSQLQAKAGIMRNVVRKSLIFRSCCA